MEEIRAFIAIELPADIKMGLEELETSLKAGRYRAKWVAPENIHLTLKFLGGISIDSINNVTQAMERAVTGITPFRLAVNGLGVFPNTQRVQIVWAGVTGNLEKLLQLQKHIDAELKNLGFVPESRPFTAHLTIARLRNEASSSERQLIGQKVIETSFEGGEFKVESVNLMKSQLTREGPIYSRLVSVTLSEGL